MLARGSLDSQLLFQYKHTNQCSLLSMGSDRGHGPLNTQGYRNTRICPRDSVCVCVFLWVVMDGRDFSNCFARAYAGVGPQVLLPIKNVYLRVTGYKLDIQKNCFRTALRLFWTSLSTEKDFFAILSICCHFSSQN